MPNPQTYSKVKHIYNNTKREDSLSIGNDLARNSNWPKVGANPAI